VLLRVNGCQLMVLSDAIPGLRIAGKSQCHVVVVTKEQRLAAASVGCARDPLPGRPGVYTRHGAPLAGAP